MKIKFTEYIYTEELDYEKIIRDAGYAHEVNVEGLTDKIWDGGTRELAVELELDTETGIIELVK